MSIVSAQGGGTKVRVIGVALGNPVALSLTPSQAADITQQGNRVNVIFW